MNHAIRMGLQATMCTLMLSLFTGCTRDASIDDPAIVSNAAADANVPAMYKGLPPKTLGELQQARNATMKYRNIATAINDGYVDIHVDVNGMGHHYMKEAIVDGIFDPRYPEILVYDDENNLVAVEYAVVKNGSYATMPPEGFSGSMDQWDGGTVPTLWLLHAWVWKYNSNGVFAPFNPDVSISGG